MHSDHRNDVLLGVYLGPDGRGRLSVLARIPNRADRGICKIERELQKIQDVADRIEGAIIWMDDRFIRDFVDPSRVKWNQKRMRSDFQYR